jgi:signal transduction histidine kinase
MKTDEELSLVERGQERQTGTMRARLFWSLLGVSMVIATPALALANSGLEVWGVVGAIALAALASAWVADSLMLPVHTLKRRLEVKNYGEREPENDPEPELDLGSNGLEFGAHVFAMGPTRKLDLSVGLPVELAAIERLARAGRVTEIAMASVKRDLFRHLSHQLKSPLALMRAHALTAKHALELNDTESIAEALKAIEAINMNTSNLVEAMLSLAWVEGLEERGLSGEKANFSAAIMQLVSLRQRAAADRGCT